MSAPLPSAVLDTVVFVQALFSGRGHSAGCLRELRAGHFVLLESGATFEELREVPFRPHFAAKYPFVTREQVERFIAEIRSLAVRIPNPPRAFSLPRDPDDEPFIDLTIAGNAEYIVTWNVRHLTYLMNQDTTEGKDFCTRYPNIRIVSPPQFLQEISRPSAH
jgi:uncharacterized protein